MSQGITSFWYPEMFDAINELFAIDESIYPRLHNLINHTRCGFVLYQLFSEIRKHENPLYTTPDGAEWYAVSLQHLVLRYGGNKSTWCGYISLAVTLGLLHRIKPDARSTAPTLKGLYEDGKAKRQKPKSLYSVPAYTPETLHRAETTLDEWERSGVSTSKITKAHTICATGQAQANSTYRDGRGQTLTVQAQLIIDRITQAIAERGYITRDQAAAGADKAWGALRGYILDVAGASYHRPTKAEVERYSLRNDAWIITQSTRQTGSN